MSVKTYGKLLILFNVLCLGIIGTNAENDIDKSSDLLVRQKRVINREPDGDFGEMIRNFPYIVQIREYNSRKSCSGVILSIDIVLTVATCVAYQIESYRVFSGTAQKSNRATHASRHDAREKIVSPRYNPRRPDEGIALISVIQPFVYSANTRNIQLYEGHIHPRSYATVSGWGCHANGDPGTAHPNYLRSITVPIISNRDCAILHTDGFTILDTHICTFDSSGHQYCTANDEGAPLVVEMNNEPKLVGLHNWSVRGGRNWAYPDVFINLLHPRYKTWIEQNMQRLNQVSNISHNPNNHSNLHQPHN